MTIDIVTSNDLLTNAIMAVDMQLMACVLLPMTKRRYTMSNMLMPLNRDDSSMMTIILINQVLLIMMISPMAVFARWLF